MLGPTDTDLKGGGDLLPQDYKMQLDFNTAVFMVAAVVLLSLHWQE